MNQPTWGMPRVSKLRVALVGALIAGVVGVVSLPSAQAVEGGDARCDALDVALFAELDIAGVITPILDVSGGTDEVVAPDPENGTNESALTTITVGEGVDSVTLDTFTCEATRADDFLSADAEIVDGDVTLGGIEVVTLNAIMSEVLCPAAGTGAPTASASANITVGGEVIDLDTDAGNLVDDANFAFVIPGVADGDINVAAKTSATADDDSAEATGLELTLTFSGSLLGQSVVLALGTITLAETSCTVGDPDQVPPTDPTAPPTDPTAPPTDPTAPPTDPTAPPTDPTTPPGGTLPPTR
ncbi:hypothetical protein BH20ACT4_BH20ACT4_07620 [soil metagenome]